MTNPNDLPAALLLRLHREMWRIRKFEEMALYQSTQGKVYGALHLYIGQEATGVGVCAALARDDYVASTHRGHGHCLAKGARMDRMMAELFGRADGYCRGKGGSMHIADLAIGMLGANGIVGASFGLAAGAALHAKVSGSGRVAVAFFGDGGVTRGTFHEVLNLAALWKLPLLLVCENNEYAQWVPFAENVAAERVADFAAAYRVPGVTVDGDDVRAVFQAASRAVARARAGEGPSLIECLTHRHYGHSLGDMQVYRSKEEVEALKRGDPISRLEQELARSGLLAAEERARLLAEIDAEVAAAVAFAEASPFPAPDALHADVVAA